MRAATAAAGLAALLALAACDSGTGERDDVTSSGVVMRDAEPLPPGSVPRGAAAYAARVAAPGPDAAGPGAAGRGEDAFLAFCSPCHGARGAGDGVVARRGLLRPPSFHEARLQGVTPERVVAVITHGYRTMYPYAERVTPEDRWAIAAHVKALQAGQPPPRGGMAGP